MLTQTGITSGVILTLGSPLGVTSCDIVMCGSRLCNIMALYRFNLSKPSGKTLRVILARDTALGVTSRVDLRKPA